MDLSYGPEYEAFRQGVREFIETNRDRAPRGEAMKSDRVQSWQKLLIDNGYTARTIPRKYGGHGGEPDIIKARIIGEEFARSQTPGGLGGQGISMLVPTLLELGTEEQKKRFIPPTLAGEMIWCQGYSEPNAGSDLASLRTSAVLDGDEWVVNGSKIWTSTAHLADWIFCLVRTEPDAPKHQGISFLLFKMDTPGIEIQPLVDMTMARNFNEVFFTDVRVPKEQIVGKRGEGWFVANAILGHERDSLGDPNSTLTRLNRLIEIARQETVGGQRLIDNPVFRDRMMKIQARVMSLRFNDQRVLSSRINNTDARLARMISKLQGTELRHDLEGLAIDIMGEIGLMYGRSDYLTD
ncbi:MAG: acyl-CoA dehydrogenase family protein, partial [Pseudomonadota bacterium]|nr:acyl-CoA dehydrogenase family protein [Pseudomonadota bacterium]